MMSFAVTLAQLAERFGAAITDQTEITQVYHNSADVTSGSIFFALPGTITHGAKYAEMAIANGAVAIITDTDGAEMISTNIPVVKVDNPRYELAQVAKLVYGPQIADMHLWGITGTNGKTTTSYMLRVMLPQPAAAIGTTGVVTNSSREPLSRTTPEIDDLYRLLIRLRKCGIKKVVMEVSSHALVLDRVTGLEFQAVAFTNLSQDHLDFHGTMDAYLQAKARLFDTKFSKYAVVCTDSAAGVAIADLAEANGLVVSTVTTSSQSGTWWTTDTVIGIDEISAVIQPLGLKLELGMGGGFNIANALTAIAMADQVSEISPTQLKRLAELQVPGRMQTIFSNGIHAVVDYAHSPGAIAAVVAELRSSVSGKLIIVIGAGGDRDASKRPLMGSALTGADLVIVTDDNPRTEDASQIRAQIISGIDAIGVSYQEIADRRVAISAAVAAVKSSNDLVAVLGKGHEQGQQIGNEIYSFDDFAELSAAILSRASNE